MGAQLSFRCLVCHQTQPADWCLQNGDAGRLEADVFRLVCPHCGSDYVRSSRHGSDPYWHRPGCNPELAIFPHFFTEDMLCTLRTLISTLMKRRSGSAL